MDVIGVIIELGTIGVIKTKTGESRNRLNITIADDSLCSVPITVWGEQCNQL